MLDRAADRRTRQRARQRRYRALRRAHRICVTVEVGKREIDFLAAAQWLDPRQDHDPRAIGDAIRRMLADPARGG
jgi:hypothetical protein